MYKTKILIADDEPVILEYMQVALGHHGYQAITANDGRETLEKAITEQPDIILLDFHMSDMDGSEICMKLKENIETANIIVFFVTGSLAEELREDISRCGAKGFILKPFNFEVLQNKLKQALKENKKLN
jgi:CheY-like chemotaxis protein